MSSMDVDNTSSILGCFEKGYFSLKSPVFGHFEVEKFLLSTKDAPPENWDTKVPGLYENRSRVFINLVGPTGNNYCHPSSVRLKNGKLSLSTCNKQLWSEFDTKNDMVHVTQFFLHRSSKLESLNRIFSIVMKFLGKLLDRINVRKYNLQFDNVHLFMGQSSFYLSYQIMQLKFPNRERTPIESKSEGILLLRRMITT